MRTLSMKLRLTLLTLFLVFGTLGTYGTAAAPTQEVPTLTAPGVPAEDAFGVRDGTTVLDTGGFFSGGTVSGGARWQVGKAILIDGSYLRPIITVNPFELYSVTAIKGEVYDLAIAEADIGVMQGAGISYVDANGYAFFFEGRVWATAGVYSPAAATFEIAVAFTAPSEAFFGN